MRTADLRAEVDAAFAARQSAWLAGNRVSRKHKYVAFMAAKAACSTVKLALHRFETPDVAVQNWWDVHFDHAAPSLADYSPDEVVEMLASPEWFRFCIVRNPYDRLASAWKQKLVSEDDDGYAWLRDKIRAASGIASEAIIPFRDTVDYLVVNSAMATDPHWAPMFTTMRPDIVGYDAVGRFESFAADFIAILRRIGAPSDVVAMATVVTNATPAIPLTDLYDEALADRVYAHYEADFASFGYERDSWRSYVGA